VTVILTFKFDLDRIKIKQHIYIVSQKNVPPLTCYNLHIHYAIAIIFWQKCYSYALFSHLTYRASALPCKRGNPEDSALVLCACNTVQLLQCSRLPFCWTMPHKSPKLNALVTRFRESNSIVSMSRESKRLKKSSSNWWEFWQCTNAVSEKMQSLCFPVLPGCAEAQVIWSGIVKCLLIAYFISSISAQKNIKIRSHMSKL